MVLGDLVFRSFLGVWVGFHVYKRYLHWSPMPKNITYIGLFGAVGDLGSGFKGSRVEGSKKAGQFRGASKES